MIKLELDGAKCIACETDVSGYKGMMAVEEAAIEIKTAIFLVMADEFVELVERTGREPSDVAESMCGVIGCRSEEFSEFIEMLVKNKDINRRNLA